MHEIKNKFLFGIFIMLLSTCCWAAMSVLVKMIANTVSTDIIVFSRFATGLVLVMPWVLPNIKKTIIIPSPGGIIGRSIVTFGVTFCFYYSLRHISIGDALVLNNTFPLFVPIIVGLTTAHNSTSIKVWASIAIGFLGVLLVIKPDSSIFNSASLIALLSGVFAAISIIIIRSLALRLSLIQILFYNFFIGTIIAGVFTLFYGYTFSPNYLLILLGIGAISTVYQFLLTYALKLVPAKIASPLTYLSIPIGILAEFLIWQHTTSIVSLFGILLIIIGGVCTIWFEGNKKLTSKEILNGSST